ncbi:MAG: SPFH domain-containing protein [Bacteroidetes bacterium]|nr:SPFH domain-containing protein [Bacteroidota bacterium]
MLLATDRIGETGGAVIMISGLLLMVFTLPGYFIIQPNESKVLVLFGKYAGSVREDGFFWSNPFFSKRRISLRARNLTTEKIKVNDRLGNPIIIGSVVVWKVHNTAMAAFEVDDYEDYVNVQSEAAVRNLAGAYSYDAFDDQEADITLRGGGEEINEMLEKELAERLELAGVEVLEARITHLAYASEIAGAMLQRQQATAVVAARFKIVEGAVSMVKMALDHLKDEGIADFDEEKRATMISNLMVVLCSEKSATPVVNTGTLYQ